MPGEATTTAPPRGEVGLQFPDAAYKAETALSGMWLFLASETLFFGAMFLTMLYCRHQHPQGFAAAAAQTQFGIGTANTVVLLCSSFAFASAVVFMRAGRRRATIAAVRATGALGAAFLLLKAIEWWLDLADHDLPGRHFNATSPDRGGEQLFWFLYWVATGIHGVHLLLGIALCVYVAQRLRRQSHGSQDMTLVKVVGLYWSFVDMVWLLLYPLIYLADRT